MSPPYLTRRRAVALIGAFGVCSFQRGNCVDTPSIDAQPYFASVKRALDRLEKLGAPIAAEHASRISTLSTRTDAAAQMEAEEILSRYTLAILKLESGGSLRIDQGGATRDLVEQGWKLFLVRVDNLTGKDVAIRFPGPQQSVAQMAPWIGSMAQRPYLLDTVAKAPMIEEMWFASEMHGAVPRFVRGLELSVLELSGFPREYHVLQLFSRDRGSKTATFTLNTPSAWFGGATRKFEFVSRPSRDVRLEVLDDDGVGCMAALTIKDSQGHVYPLQAMRLAPDMFFQEHIYRADGETVRLPDGEYTVVSARGPEYLKGVQSVMVRDGNKSIAIKLKRWINPGNWGWYSGDPHIHASGCLHYQVPTEGVTPETMIRHVRGEALSIGEVLAWGPSWYYQKQFFSGNAISPPAELEHRELQAANNVTWQSRRTMKDSDSLLRYDVEVSGFPSSLSGHLALLRLKEQDYPGAQQIEDWPSWNLPILRWAKSQEAVTGYTHCALGMVVESEALPNYVIPPFDSIGMNEAIVDVTHGLLDFLAGCNLFPHAELNGWYHMLNCGFRVALVGETDYPCISGERPGFGRTYVQLPDQPRDDAGYEAWVLGIQRGQVYCGDGRSHILNFSIAGRRAGDVLAIDKAKCVRVQATVAARLEPQPLSQAEMDSPNIKGRWHLENARIGGTRDVPVELIVNGSPMQRAQILADGVPRKVEFEVEIARSSWIALRILPSSHSCPISVLVGDKPVRASRRSAKWCRECVDKLWDVKSKFIRPGELAAASAAYDHARRTYEAIGTQCEID